MSNEYVIGVAYKYHTGVEIDVFTQVFVIDPLKEIIKQWAGDCYNDVYLSGSRVKGTAIKISSDLDLFISLKSNTENTLKEIYQSLNNFLISKGFKTREQNVSIGVEVQSKQIDLVPAKKRSGNTNYHSLYLSKQNSWIQTNVIEHINKIKDSGRIIEIILLKVWRRLHSITFPSIYLELIVIEALKNKSKNDPANNFWTVLQYLRDDFIYKIVIDPANTNNIISNDLYQYEKEIIKRKAIKSLSQKYWKDVIW
jgi:hypothetical protein